MMPKDYVPPLVIDRVVATYTFEGGGFVSIVSGGKIDTSELLEMIDQLVDLKRAEMKRKSQSAALLGDAGT